jgi:DMSO/TMAO reductase YedYZ molybdopterin-dependent catalytic subunit
MGLPPGQRYVKKFVKYSIFPPPKVDLRSYRLKVSGAVKMAFSLSYDDMLKFTMVSYTESFHCVDGWSVKDVRFEGIPLKELILKAGPRRARYVMLRCLEGYETVVPLEDALSDRAIVALKMNGSPLSEEHGFPARTFIPHLYGWKSAKWLCEIELLEEYEDGYWERRGYHERGNVFKEERFKPSSSRKEPGSRKGS